MSDRFVEALLRTGVASKEQITKARHTMRKRGGSFTKRLRRAGCDADEVLKVLCNVSKMPRASSKALLKSDLKKEALSETEHGIWWHLMAAPFSNSGGILRVAFVEPEVAKEASLLGLPKHVPYLGSEKEIKHLLTRIFGSEPENSVIVTGLLPRPQFSSAHAIPQRNKTDANAKTQMAPLNYQATLESEQKNAQIDIDIDVDIDINIDDVFSDSTANSTLRNISLPSSEKAVKTGVHYLPEGPFSTEALPLLEEAALEPVTPNDPNVQKEAREQVVARLRKKGNYSVVVGEATAFFTRPDFSELSPESIEDEPITAPTKTFQKFDIDGYHAIEIIGSGSTSNVFLVEDRESNALLALKIMNENARHHAHELTRFKRAIKLMRQLEHPAIIQIIDFGAQNRVPYMITPFFDGGTLKQLLNQTPQLPPAAAVLIAESILEALSHAHSKNVVHRDLKPENILLATDGTVAIADFGLARKHPEQQNQLTKAGETLGSAPYMAPEQALGEKIDARADLFSVGVILYEMLTGQSPFQAEKFSISLFRVVESDVNEPFVLSPTIPMALDWVVQRLMKKDKTKRFQSARATLQELKPFIRFIRQQYPTLLPALIRSPKSTQLRLTTDQGQAELHRTDTLLRTQPPQFIEASFAAWRAANLLPESATYAKELAQQFQLFTPTPPKKQPHALRDDLWQNAAVHARAMATRALNSGDIVNAALHLRRHLIQNPSDHHGAAQLRAIVGQNPWAPFPIS